MQCPFVAFNILSNLYANSYMVIFTLLTVRRCFIRICLVVCLDIFSIKILSDAEASNMFAFSFHLSFVSGTYGGHCILSYFSWKKRRK